jgi:hypothetical protein
MLAGSIATNDEPIIAGKNLLTMNGKKMHILANTKRVYANAKRQGLEKQTHKYVFSEGNTDTFEDRESKEQTRIPHRNFNRF